MSYDDTTVAAKLDSLTTSIGSTDISSIGDGTITGAISSLNSGKQDILTNPLTQSDIVNNLTTDDSTKPLSAAQEVMR